MGLKYNPDETLESWMSRVESHELELAKKKIAKGIPVDEVLERMAKNIANKMLHPVIVNLMEHGPDLEKFEISKKQYEDMYLKKVPRASDHVSD